MMVMLYNLAKNYLATLQANSGDILTIVIAVGIFIFFLACMGKALGMSVSLNLTVIFTAAFAVIALIFRGLGWIVRNIFRGIRGCYRGSYNFFHSAGMAEFGSRCLSLLVTGILIAVII